MPLSMNQKMDEKQAAQTIFNAIALRPLNWEICRAVSYAIWCCTEIEIDIRYPNPMMASNDSSSSSSARGVIYVQQTAMGNLEMAADFVHYICSNARVITKFRMNVEVSDSKAADALIRAVLSGKQVHLEEIRVRRRYVGQQFPLIPDLISAHADSLRVVGKLGLSEAIQAFDERIHLDRFALINFDLIDDGRMESERLAESTRFALRRLAGLGATFHHFSYTTYAGFEITKHPAMYMLKACKVKSIRLTQQKGTAIADPLVIRPLLPELRRIELVGCMEVASSNLDALFPNLEHFHFQKVDLATGGGVAMQRGGPEPTQQQSRHRDYIQPQVNFPIAAGC